MLVKAPLHSHWRGGRRRRRGGKPRVCTLELALYGVRVVRLHSSALLLHGSITNDWASVANNADHPEKPKHRHLGNCPTQSPNTRIHLVSPRLDNNAHNIYPCSPKGVIACRFLVDASLCTDLPVIISVRST